MKCDILNLEWGSSGRDIHIVEPVLSYIEIKFGLNVVRESIWHGELKLLKYRPKVLLISNSTGATNNFRIVKLAHLIGIKTVALISEGDIVEKADYINKMFWGWNTDKKSYEDLTIFWTERTVQLAKKNIPESAGFNLKYSGATGFDRYKLFSFSSKEEFKEKLNKDIYKKVIGLAGWGFDLYSEETLQKSLAPLPDECYYFIDFYNKSRKELNNVYKQLVENNPDILFVAKFHPGTVDRNCTEFEGLSNFPNVVELFREEISDIINACDIWIAFESTTCLEAWLLGKQTFLINPCGENFPRSLIYKGSPVYFNYERSQKAINDFYEIGNIPAFLEKEDERERLIKYTIEHGDGKNHQRAADFVFELFKDSRKKKKTIDLFVLKTLTKALVKWVLYHTPLKYTVYKYYKLHEYTKNTYYSSFERGKISDLYRIKLKEFHNIL